MQNNQTNQNKSIDKLRGYLGLSIRAGKIVFGADNIIEWRKKNYGMFADANTAQNTLDKMRAFAETRGLEFTILPNNLDLSTLMHKENVKVIAISSKNLYTIIKETVDNLDKVSK